MVGRVGHCSASSRGADPDEGLWPNPVDRAPCELGGARLSALLFHDVRWRSRPRRNRSPKPSTTSGIRRSCVTCYTRSLRRCSTSWRRGRLWVGSARPTPSAGQRANARCNGGSVTTLRTIGAKVPKASTATVPPHLADSVSLLGSRKSCDSLTPDSATPTSPISLFISTRTVESHVSSMLQKTGRATREQLPPASSAEN